MTLYNREFFKLFELSFYIKADDMNSEVPDWYKVMPIGGSEWLEPTDNVICE